MVPMETRSRSCLRWSAARSSEVALGGWWRGAWLLAGLMLVALCAETGHAAAQPAPPPRPPKDVLVDYFFDNGATAGSSVLRRGGLFVFDDDPGINTRYFCLTTAERARLRVLLNRIHALARRIRGRRYRVSVGQVVQIRWRRRFHRVETGVDYRRRLPLAVRRLIREMITLRNSGGTRGRRWDPAMGPLSANHLCSCRTGN